MNEVLKRSITGAVFISMIILGITFGSYTTFLVFGLFCILGIHEFFKLFKNSKYPTLSVWFPTIIYSLTYIAFLAAEFGYMKNYMFLLIIPLLFIFFLVELFKKDAKPIENMGVYLIGGLYVLVPFLLMNFINPKGPGHEVESIWPLLGMFIIIWTSDTFAYLTGRKFGKTRLFERISPKKSWEGSIGGLIFALIAGGVISIFDQSHGLWFWLAATPVIVVFGAIGDLVESMLKRNLEVKDSGKILPGHGGILDRFDSALFAAPFLFIFYILVEKI
jgi:phosphatidate cytidylyltransferase